MKLFAKSSALLLSAVLAASLLVGCGASSSQAASSAAAEIASSAVSSEVASSEAASSEASSAAIAVTFNVTDAEGTVTALSLSATEGESLADALLTAEVISQEEHDAGFVTVVNGIAADYNADKAWWMLVDANGEMTPTGIADIALHEGDSYGFVYTVG